MQCDVFLPQNGSLHPLVVCFNGGIWNGVDRTATHDTARALVDHGMCAVSTTYRRSTRGSYEAILEDARSCLRHLTRSAIRLRIDTDRMAFFGLGSGAHVAALVACERPRGRCMAVACVSPFLDLTRPREQHFPSVWTHIERLIGMPYDGFEDVYEQASPLFQISEHLPPFFIAHGIDDQVVPIGQSDAFVAALTDARIPHEYLRVDGQGHVFDLETWVTIEKRLVQFFRRVLDYEP